MRASRFLTAPVLVFWSVGVLSPSSAANLPGRLWASSGPPASPLSARRPQERTKAAAVTELLDRLQETVARLGGPASEADLGHELSVLANYGRDILAEGIVTPAFHARYSRLLLVIRLAVITDTGRVLASITDREFASFVRDVTGKTYDPQGPVSDQIGMFSEAVATELTRLRTTARQLK